MLCVENVYVEVNMYVTLWSMIMMIHGAWCDIKNDFETVILTYKKAT